MISIKESLEGFFGVPSKNIPHNIPKSTPSDVTSVTSNAFVHSHCDHLRSEQQLIIRTITINDVFVNMSAGGGKSLPFICYWLNNLLNINVMHTNIPSTIRDLTFLENSRNIPKLFWTVPTKALAVQMYDKMCENIKNILMQYIQKMSKIDENIQSEKHFCLSVDKIINLLNLTNLIPLNNNFLNLIRNKRTIIYNYSEEYYTQQQNQLINNIQTFILQNIDKRVKSLIYLQTGDGSRGIINKAIVFISIHQSAPNLIFKHVIENLSLFIIDEAHQLTYHYKDEEQSKDIALAIYKVLDYFSKNDTIRFAMISGTINNSSAKKLTKFLNMTFNRKFKNLLLPGKNETPISVVINDNLSFQQKWPKLIADYIKRKQPSNLFILYSVRQIGQLAEKVLKLVTPITLSNIDSVSTYGSPVNRLYHNTMTNRPKTLSDTVLPTTPTTAVANRIQNPLLRKCVNAGFGFDYGKKTDKEYEPITLEDKKFVYDLFTRKKIFFLIATDSLGVGLNISAQRMFIPNIKTFSPRTGEMERIQFQDIVQIINRVGRGKFSNATIYTVEENVEYIISAINATESDFNITNVYQFFKNKNIMKKYFLSLFKRFRNPPRN